MKASDTPPVHVTVVGSPDDPRRESGHDGVVVHHTPSLHPEEVVTLPSGLRVTSVARTLIDLANDMTRAELRAAFERADQLGIGDIEAVRRPRARMEWRPSSDVLDAVIAEFSL